MDDSGDEQLELVLQEAARLAAQMRSMRGDGGPTLIASASNSNNRIENQESSVATPQQPNFSDLLTQQEEDEEVNDDEPTASRRVPANIPTDLEIPDHPSQSAEDNISEAGSSALTFPTLQLCRK